MKRGDTALWILTKMAMVFFIVSLAAVLLLFGNRAQEGLCNSEAHTLSQSIASAISQTLNTPLEDQRQLISLPPSLSIGNGINSRYLVTLSRLNVPDPAKPNPPKPNLLIVETRSQYNPSCSSSVQLSYDKSWEEIPSGGSIHRLTFSPASASRLTSGSPPYLAIMTLKPSVSYDPADPRFTTDPRTRFISLVTCTQKTTARTRFVFIEDCTQEGSHCIGSGSSGSMDFSGDLSVCNFQ